MQRLQERVKDKLLSIDETRKRDAERWKNRDEYRCMVCGDVGNDRRTLLISMFYDLTEISDVFHSLFNVSKELEGFYGCTICKGCRASLMRLLGAWIRYKGREIFKITPQGLVFLTKEEIERMRRE